MSEYSKEELEEAGKKNVAIKVSVLFQVLKIIDVAHQRGLFKASELSTVGSVYDAVNERVEKAIATVRMPNNNNHGHINNNGNNGNNNNNNNNQVSQGLERQVSNNNQELDNMMKRQMADRENIVPGPDQMNQNNQGQNQNQNQNQNNGFINQNQSIQVPIYQPMIQPAPAREMPPGLQPIQTKEDRKTIQAPNYNDIVGQQGLGQPIMRS